MPLVYSTFDSGLIAALVRLCDAYLKNLGDDFSSDVVNQMEVQTMRYPLVIVSPTEIEEMVYQSGHYRVGVEFSINVDMDIGSPQQMENLAGAVLDFLQQTDLIQQLNTVTDDTGRALCVVQLVTIEQSRLEDIGDRKWRRVLVVDFLGHAPLS